MDNNIEIKTEFGTISIDKHKSNNMFSVQIKFNNGEISSIIDNWNECVEWLDFELNNLDFDYNQIGVLNE